MTFAAALAELVRGAHPLPAAPFLLASLSYAAAARRSTGRSTGRLRRPWPLRRSLCWHAGTLAAAAAVAGPAAALHAPFPAHMLAHLLLGMLAPLLLVLGEPVALTLRALPTGAARRFARWLRAPAFRLAADPAFAALLHIGGLWLLYRTPLYAAMHHQPALHLAVHVHLFLAGFLFTYAIVPAAVTPHRPGLGYRAVVLLLSSAAHGTLSKLMYAAPPAGVPIAEARAGALFMYYGGDAVTIALTAAFCAQWYASSRTRGTNRRIRGA
ncbi:cytochrome c oxidase assembly protein [Paenibacillus sp. TRM 82003]|nr:cytochrome c oxidase assembly protein [Paenibacillus sp. TRM 82003]